MSRVFKQISIPIALRDEMLLQEGGTFPVPLTKEGSDFMSWWESAPINDKREVLKLAYRESIPVTEALKRRGTDAQ